MQRLQFWILIAIALVAMVGCGGGGKSSSSADNVFRLAPAGGTYNYQGKVALALPAGAVAADTSVTVNALTTAPTGPSGFAYVPGSGFSFTHTTFSTPATLKITYPTGTTTTGMKIYRREDGGSTWTPVDTTIDAANRQASASISSFSSYALFYPAGTGWIWTSAAQTFTFDNLSVALPASAVSTSVEVQPRRTPTPFTPPAGYAAVTGATFDLGSSDTNLTTAVPFDLTITVPDTVGASAKIFYKENETAAWSVLSTTFDATAHWASAQSTKLGTFAVFTPIPLETFWVELAAVQNSQTLNIYSAGTNGVESLVRSVPVQFEGGFLRSETFRWDDQLMLAISKPANYALGEYNVTTGVYTPRFDVPSYVPGSLYTDLIAARSHGAPSPYIALLTREENNTTLVAKDVLLRFRTGSATPDVLATIDRSAGGPPNPLRPWDVDAAGRVLVQTANGLTMFDGTTQTVLVGPEVGAAEAYFSPSATKVLYKQNSGTDAGWKVIDIASRATVSVGVGNAYVSAWGQDDDRVICANRDGDTRTLVQIQLSTGATNTVTSRGVRDDLLTQVGIH